MDAFLRLSSRDRRLACLQVEDRMGHREIFFHISWVDYTTLRPGSLRLLPLPHDRDAWRRDYEQMRGPMFFGEIPSFAEILRVVGGFEQQFNRTAEATQL